MRLLYHVADHGVDVLDPSNYKEKAICLSEGVFIGALGQWLYIFDHDVLRANFKLLQLSSGGKQVLLQFPNLEYRFHSQPLGTEYRIHDRIDVKEFALGVAQNFEICQGVLEKRMMGEISRQSMDLTDKPHFDKRQRLRTTPCY